MRNFFHTALLYCRQLVLFVGLVACYSLAVTVRLRADDRNIFYGGPWIVSGQTSRTNSLACDATLFIRGTRLRWYGLPLAGTATISDESVTLDADPDAEDGVDLITTAAGDESNSVMIFERNYDMGDHIVRIGMRAGNLSLSYLEIETDDTVVPETMGPVASTVPLEALLVDCPRAPGTIDGVEFRYSREDPGRGGFVGSYGGEEILDVHVEVIFQGSAIWLFGTGAYGPTLNVAVDGGDRELIEPDPNAGGPQRLLYSRTGLDHTTTHRVVFDSFDQGTKNYDFVRILRGPSSTSSSSDISTTSSGTTSASGTGNSQGNGGDQAGVSDQNNPQSSSPPQSTSTSSNADLPPSTIAGITVGAIVVVVLAGFIFWYWRRDQKHHQKKRKDTERQGATFREVQPWSPDPSITYTAMAESVSTGSGSASGLVGGRAAAKASRSTPWTGSTPTPTPGWVTSPASPPPTYFSANAR